MRGSAAFSGSVLGLFASSQGLGIARFAVEVCPLNGDTLADSMADDTVLAGELLVTLSDGGVSRTFGS